VWWWFFSCSHYLARSGDLGLCLFHNGSFLHILLKALEGRPRISSCTTPILTGSKQLQFSLAMAFEESTPLQKDAFQLSVAYTIIF